MSKRSGLWIMPYFAAAIIWVLIYKDIGSLSSLYFAGKQNPLVFIVILGMFLHMVSGIIRARFRPHE